jgi:hypothetical protein
MRPARHFCSYSLGWRSIVKGGGRRGVYGEGEPTGEEAKQRHIISEVIVGGRRQERWICHRGLAGRGSHQGRLPSGSAPGVAWSIRRAGGAMCQVGRASEVERGSSARRLDRARGGSDRSSNKERALGLAWFWTGAEK